MGVDGVRSRKDANSSRNRHSRRATKYSPPANIRESRPATTTHDQIHGDDTPTDLKVYCDAWNECANSNFLGLRPILCDPAERWAAGHSFGDLADLGTLQRSVTHQPLLSKNKSEHWLAERLGVVTTAGTHLRNCN